MTYLERDAARYIAGAAGGPAPLQQIAFPRRPVRRALGPAPGGYRTIACWRFATVPSALTPDEAERFLQAFDQPHADGQSGNAIARCLLFGLRTAEAVALQLQRRLSTVGGECRERTWRSVGPTRA